MEELADKITKITDGAVKSRLGLRDKFTVPADKLPQVGEAIKGYGFDHIESVAGTDYIKEGYIELLYLVGSVRDDLKRTVVAFGCRLPRDKPTSPSLVGVWPGVEFHEREQHEMLGIEFQNHPRLANLLLPDDWSDIPPLRKDYHIKKWGHIEREDWKLVIERANVHKIAPELIPAKEDFEKVKRPALVKLFTEAPSTREVDVLGRQLFDIVHADEKTLAVSFGIQHPGSGHMRLMLGIDGDIVTSVEPDIGYVHRGEEKMCEYKNFFQNIPHLERPVIHDSCGILFPYVLAVEELLDLTDKIPERAKYLRIIMAEFNRIISHMYWLGIMGIMSGHSTMFMWGMGDRELIIDAAGLLGGARVTFAYFIPGGVRNDSPPGFEEYVLKICDKFEERLDAYRSIYFDNELFISRSQGVGALSRQDAIDLGAVGPPLRASGVHSDTRKDEPYSLYDTIDFGIPVWKEGDSYARCMISYLEMYQSLRIIRQVIKNMKPGPVRIPLRWALRPRVGEAYARAEAAHGALSYYIVSDGKPEPYRVKISTPSFRNMPIIVKKILPGNKVADVPIIHWSLNYWAVEGDK